jgi:hypothetical protein
MKRDLLHTGPFFGPVCSVGLVQEGVGDGIRESPLVTGAASLLDVAAALQTNN